MSRLTHSEAGFWRTLQVSNSRLFVFTEGGLDRPFAERLIRFNFPSKSWSHQVIAIKEFPAAAGGKTALLKLFRALRKRKELSFSAFGKPMVCVIFADKDIDDVTRRKLRSDHLFYTPTYDVEGLLFLTGDLESAVSDACLVTRAQASGLIGGKTAFITEYVKRWTEWVSLCMLCHANGINAGCGYKQPSRINPNFVDHTDAALLAALVTQIRTQLGLSFAQFDALHKRYEKRFTNALGAEPLKYFKGKWLQLILQKHLDRQPKVPDSNVSSVGERVISALVAQVGATPGCASCAPYVATLQPLCAGL